jgi:hypothetical protein
VGWPGAEVGRDRAGSGARQSATPPDRVCSISAAGMAWLTRLTVTSSYPAAVLGPSPGPLLCGSPYPSPAKAPGSSAGYLPGNRGLT